jgi:hypothetical protein
MGWVESPPFFCMASETARDVVGDYCKTRLGTLPSHKFLNYLIGNASYGDLPKCDSTDTPLQYILKVYMGNFLSL